MAAATRLSQQHSCSLERLLGCAAGEKLTALAWNRDPREIRTHHRAQSAGAQSALGKKPAEEQVFRPALRHLADRVASRLRAKSRPGRTVTVRVRFADLHSVTRSVTLDAPISATLPLPKLPRSSFVRRSPIVLTRRPYRCWRSQYRILRSTGKCSWNFRWGLKMKSAGPAPREGWRVGRQTTLLT